jgi:hypothetical protein
MNLAPLKVPGSSIGGLPGGKPMLGPLKGIPPLKNNLESMQPKASAPSGIQPSMTKAVTNITDVGKKIGMQLSYEESDDDVVRIIYLCGYIICAQQLIFSITIPFIKD